MRIGIKCCTRRCMLIRCLVKRRLRSRKKRLKQPCWIGESSHFPRNCAHYPRRRVVYFRTRFNKSSSKQGRSPAPPEERIREVVISPCAGITYEVHYDAFYNTQILPAGEGLPSSLHLLSYHADPLTPKDSSLRKRLGEGSWRKDIPNGKNWFYAMKCA